MYKYTKLHYGCFGLIDLNITLHVVQRVIYFNSLTFMAFGHSPSFFSFFLASLSVIGEERRLKQTYMPSDVPIYTPITSSSHG